MPKNGKKSPWEILVNYPPVFVRLYAKERSGPRMHRALSDQEVAIRGNIPVDIVRRISRMTTWDNVTVGVSRSFCKGCNFDFLAIQTEKGYQLTLGEALTHFKGEATNLPIITLRRSLTLVFSQQAITNLQVITHWPRTLQMLIQRQSLRLSKLVLLSHTLGFLLVLCLQRYRAGLARHPSLLGVHFLGSLDLLVGNAQIPTI